MGYMAKKQVDNNGKPSTAFCQVEKKKNADVRRTLVVKYITEMEVEYIEA